MPNRKLPTKQPANFGLLNPVKPLPKDALRTQFAQIRDQKNSQSAQKHSTLQKMASSLGRAQGLSKPDFTDPKSAKAAEQLLALHKKLASKKLQIPKVALPPGGILAGTISARVTPPYDFDITIDTILGEAG